MDHDATWYGGRPRSKRQCLMGDTAPTPQKGTAPNFWLMSIVAKWSPISATAEHLFPLCYVYNLGNPYLFFLSVLLWHRHFPCRYSSMGIPTLTLILTLTLTILNPINPNCNSTHTHNHFTALFLGTPRWAGARRELLDFMVQGKINRGRHTNHQAGRHSIQTNQCPPPPSPIFYRPDALPAAQPTLSKHWRQLAHSD